jgi:hypothetical protein
LSDLKIVNTPQQTRASMVKSSSVEISIKSNHVILRPTLQPTKDAITEKFSKISRRTKEHHNFSQRSGCANKDAKMDGEDAKERHDYITNIINGLERYNPEAVGTLEGYLQEQCEQRFCDCNANRTLLKLYVSTPWTILANARDSFTVMTFSKRFL